MYKIGVEALLGSAQWDMIAQIQFLLKPFKAVTVTLRHSTTIMGNVILVVGLQAVVWLTLVPKVQTLVIRLEE